MAALLQLAIYNPGLLKDEDFLAAFVARQATVEQLISHLKQITPKGLAKHRLILGQRGMGKTSLLRRLALAVRTEPQLNAQLLPLVFREEQYNVQNLNSLWLNCLDALGDYYDKNGEAAKAAALDAQIAALSRQTHEPEGEAALALLKSEAKREGKRLLLLIDNIDLILQGLKHQDLSLRRSLQEAGGMVVYGASAALMEAVNSPNAAFYDFFAITTLKKLDVEEHIRCLGNLAQQRGAAGKPVLDLLARDPGRIRALYELTGGNPRTLMLLYTLLEAEVSADIQRDLERLLDEVTVLYKARVEDLAPQARVVLDALALHWNPATAADLSTASGMETPAVSAQLDRLVQAGVVEKTNISSSKRTAFLLAERFFNIWYLMRHAPRRQRTRLRWLTGFLQSFYTPQQLHNKALNLLRQAGKGISSDLALALSAAVENGNLRNLLGHDARRALEQQAAAEGKRLEDLCAPEDFPQAQTAVDWFIQGWWLHVELHRYEDAEAAYRQAIALDAQFAWTWNGLGNLLQNHLGRYAEAEAAYRQAIALDAQIAWPWNNLGKLLQNHLGRYPEAEAAYRQAIVLDAKNATPWNSLGILLQSHLGRYAEAEAAYRHAIALDEKDARPWNGLGNLLQDLNRSEEAKSAYQQGLKLLNEASSGFAILHSNLAYLQLITGADPEPHLELALAQLPPHGAGLLRSYAALAADNFGAACTELEQVFAAEAPDLYVDYYDDLLRNLRLAHTRGYGEKLLNWMDTSGIADRHWPLYAAMEAYVLGAAKLQDVNPEVRGAAARIYQALLGAKLAQAA